MNPKEIYRKFLSDEYTRRRSRNLSYSLRAFSRDLGVPSPKLSQYLNGTCGLSGERAAMMGAKLGLSPIEIELFICSADAVHARGLAKRNQAMERLKSLLSQTFSEINMEKFNLIRDWYHLAILELTEIEEFENTSAWVAQALGISEDQVQAAVERLESLGLLQRDQGKWMQTEKDFETPTDISSRAIRDYHHQMLRLVGERFEEIPLADREMGSVVFGVEKDLIPDFKKLVHQFQKDVASLAQKSKKKNALYVCNLQLMPIFEYRGNV